MAGGKETPRQKMIGMMYLVLTALLALNVSKQIISAFITLNDKLETSTMVINSKANDSYSKIDQKKIALIALESDLSDFEIWEAKAIELKAKTKEITSFLLSECNEMIKTVEGEDWVKERDEEGNITELKSLYDIQAIDNYDVPTHMFVGGNPQEPNKRGLELMQKFHDYRNQIAELMGTYDDKSKSFSMVAPNSPDGLKASFENVNEEDTLAIAQFYKTLTLPEYLHSHGDDELMPWASVTFDHAPIVAAAAMFTSLRLDIKNAEAVAAQYILDKINAPIFEFNKIQPMAMAPSQYVNAGDSIPLNIMVAAYDTNTIASIRYGMDADTIPENWTETTGALNVSSSEPGQHKVKGVIGVQERGEISWKPWEFSYTVGQPMGVVAQPEMRVLYIGYDNVVEATASGYPAENVSMQSSGCRIVQENGKYIAKVARGTRSATISVVGKNEDGSSSNVGSYQYKCVPLPEPDIMLGGIKDGDEVSLRKAKDARTVIAKYPPEVTLDANFQIISGKIRVGSIPGNGSVGSGGAIDARSKSKIGQGKGSVVSVQVKYRMPDGTTKQGGLSFFIKP
jgi:GldM N-terminal domain/GldM third domain/GldM second domain